MGTDVSALADELQAVVGDRLRAVATYAGDDHDIGYLRDDVAPKADVERVERIHEELVLGAIGGGYQEELFDLGGLRATVRYFEEGVVYHVPGETYTGVFVSVDEDAAARGPAIIDASRAYLRSQSPDDRPMVRGAQ